MEKNVVKEQQVIDILSANAGVVSVSIDEEGVRVETTKKMPININVGHGTQFTFCCKYSKEVDITKCFETLCAIYERYEGYFEANIVPVNGEVMIKLYASASEIPADEFNEIFDYIVEMYYDCLCFIAHMLNDEQSATINDDGCCDN